jgi:hypothetical protein
MPAKTSRSRQRVASKAGGRKPSAKTPARTRAPSAKTSARTRSLSSGARPRGPSRAKKPRMLAGGNPQIAKGEGDAPIQAYIAALSGWKQQVCRRLDEVIGQAVPAVRKAVKWNSPFYGMEGQGWFLSFHVFTNYVKVTFFKGRSLRPLPPGESTNKDARHFDIREDGFDQAQMKAWAKQASAIPGWGG